MADNLSYHEMLDALHEEWLWNHKARDGLCGHCIEDQRVLPIELADGRTVKMCRLCSTDRYYTEFLIPTPRGTTPIGRRYITIRSIPFEGEIRTIDYELSITAGLV